MSGANRTLAALVALAAGACSSLDPLERGVCGNGVIEAGEDCDSSDPSCVACAVVCTTAGDCPTSDYACGTDGRCHAPGGALGKPVAAGAFQVDDYRVTDVDRDGLGDVLGVSKTSIVVSHGDPAATLARVDSFVTPTQTGPAAFGQLDGSGAQDVVITTPDGLVAFTSPYGTLAPLDAQQIVTGADGHPLDLLDLFRISDLAIGGFVVQDDQVLLVAVDFLNDAHSGYTAPCAQPVARTDFDPARVEVYQTVDNNLATDIVVALSVGSGASAQTCVVALHKEALTSALWTDVTPAGQPVFAAKPVLADLNSNGDHCPGLVNPDDTGAIHYWDGALVGGHCTLTPVSTIPANTAATSGAHPVGRVALDPPVPFVAPDALLYSDGIYAYAAGAGDSTWTALYRTTRTLARAALADIDGDGAMDAVLAAADEDDLDILYRSTNPEGYQLVRLDTASAVTSLTFGDYDGNGLVDLAYTEQLGDHERLMVSYGTSDRLQPPVEMASFPQAIAVVRMDIADSVDMLAQAADLAILQPPIAAGDGNTMSFFHGSPQRTLIPYIDPRPSDDASKYLFRGAIVGGAEALDFANVVGLAPPAPGGGATSVDAWRIAGVAGALDGSATDPVATSGLADCGQAGPTPGGSGGGLCVGNAVYLPWPAAGGSETVVAIDRATPAHAAILAPWSGDALTAAASDLLLAPTATGAQIRSLHAADLDGDGAPELVAAYAGGDAAGLGAILVCAMDASGAPTSCVDVAPAIVAAAPDTTACIDAAPGRASYRDALSAAQPAADLVAVCRSASGSTLFRVELGAGPTVAGVEPLAHTAATLKRLELGDVTGDGVADLIALSGEDGAQSLVVYPQCSSRELTSCALGTDEGGGE